MNTAIQSSIQSFNFGEIAVSFRQDGFLNATQIAKHFGKRVQHYLDSEQTQNYISALSEAVKTASQNLVIIRKGNSKQFTQGTWLNPKFAVWCDEQIEKIISGNQSTPKTTADERTGLRQAVSALVGKFGIDYASAYSLIHQRFNIDSIEELSHSQLPEAVQYCHTLVLDKSLHGEVLDKPRTETASFSNKQLQDMACLTYYAAWGMELLKKYSMPLRSLGLKDDAASMITLWQESQSRICSVRAALENAVPQLEPYTAEYIHDSFQRADRKKQTFVF